MLYYLNNCQNQDHPKIYGGKAMYDLWPQGFEDRIAREISAGDTCLVASRVGKDKVAFARYRFLRAQLVPDPSGKKPKVWVLEGDLENREVLPRTEAIRRAPYSRFFNKLGHFSQWSAVRGD